MMTARQLIEKEMKELTIELKQYEAKMNKGIDVTEVIVYLYDQLAYLQGIFNKMK